MEKWHESIEGISAYNHKKKAFPDNLPLYQETMPSSPGLSPLTNFCLNIVHNAIQDRNIILAIPETALRPLPLIMFLYSHLLKRSVLTFTQHSGSRIIDNLDQIHNRNYHLYTNE